MDVTSFCGTEQHPATGSSYEFRVRASYIWARPQPDVPAYISLANGPWAYSEAISFS